MWLGALADGEGNPMAVPPVIREISKHPVLSKTKLIAEPWDCGGLYQVRCASTLSSPAVPWDCGGLYQVRDVQAPCHLLLCLGTGGPVPGKGPASIKNTLKRPSDSCTRSPALPLLWSQSFYAVCSLASPGYGAAGLVVMPVQVSNS